MKFITTNKHKLKEAKELLNLDLEQLAISLPEIQSTDPKEVVSFKVKSAEEDNIFAEDTGLFLGENNEIGALIKWMSNERVVKAYLNEKAIAVCCIGLKHNNKITHFSGEIEGTIVEPRGENGFGWDYIFQPKGFNKTFGEMTDKEKNKISQRSKAFKKLANYIKT